MTLKELENKKIELRKRLQDAKPEELAEIRKEIEDLQNVKIEEELDERSLLKGAIDRLETRSSDFDLINAKEIEKPKMEERKVEEKELIEQRAKDLKEGKSIKIAFDSEEQRSVTVQGGTILVPKKYKNEISESFNAVSGMVDMLNTVPLNGGDLTKA